MKPGNLFQLEMATHFATRSTILLRFGLALLLGSPFIFFAMPLEVRIPGLVVLMLFMSFFGAAVSIVRRRTEGLLLKLRILPLSRLSIFSDFVLSSSLIDLMQFTPLLILYLLFFGQSLSLSSLLWLACLLLLSVLLLNFLGVLLGLALRTNPEVHLVGALAVGLIAFFSGLIPTPTQMKTFLGAVLPWNPVNHLRKALFFAGIDQPFSAPIPSLALGIFLSIMIIIFLLRAIGWRQSKPGVKG